jgi:hypothetical protein
VWACRLALLAAAGIVVMLWLAVGLHPLLGTLFVTLTGLLFLVVTRISAETGMFLIQPRWQPAAVVLGIFGAGALGPHATVVLGLLCAVMTIDPRVCLMPLVANALRVVDRQGIEPRRIARWMALAIVLALAAGVFATVYVQYSAGTLAIGSGWPDYVGNAPFRMLGREMLKFKDPDPARPQGLLLGLWRPETTFLWAAGIGVMIMPLCYVCRLRYARWPIHPVLFLVMGTYPGALFAPSFLLAWLIKGTITHFGGGQAYRNARPIFFGLIAGEFAAAIFWMICGLFHYAATGLAAMPFRTHP